MPGVDHHVLCWWIDGSVEGHRGSEVLVQGSEVLGFRP